MERTDTKEALFPLEENLKKALTELLILHLLSEKDYYIGELTETISQKSRGALSIVFPYGAIYRLLQSGYIYESEKKTAPDGRRRQYFQITERGRTYERQLRSIYVRFSGGVASILGEGDEDDVR